MRKAIIRTTLTVFAVFFLASQASASPIAIGWLQWLQTVPGQQGQFTIVNQTGTNYQFDPAFPVEGQLTFGSLVLTVVPNGIATLTQDPIDGISYNSGFYGLPFPTSASLTGIVNESQVMVDLDGGGPNPSALWNILNGAIKDFNGNTVVLSTSPYSAANPPQTELYIDAEPVRGEVPEPATMFLLGSGVVGLVARRRRARKA